MASLAVTRSTQVYQPTPSELQKTSFVNAAGEFAQYYLKNNPWKLSPSHPFQKLFRFCVVCGEDRFSSEVWSKVLRTMWGSPAICNKVSCYEALAVMPKFIPRKHYLVETAEDQRRAKKAMDQECFEEIERVTYFPRYDRVYNSDEEMPVAYLDIFKQLEAFPVETRIAQIEEIFFAFAEENNIPLVSDADQYEDPFLNVLSEYRQKTMALLQALESFQEEKMN